MKKYLLLILVAFISFGISAQFLSTQGTDIVDENGDPYILRGIGLGGWMLQEGYMLQTAEFADAQHAIKEKIRELIGSAATEEFYDAWLQNHVTRADIDSLAAWGFNHVRLPMHYNLYTLPIEDEPVRGENTWLTRGFEMTDSLIAWCATNDMYVVLDLHAAPGGQGGNSGISDYDPSKPSLWESSENQNKCIALWRRLADRYKDEPWVAGYDLLNEVNWNLPGGTALRSIYERITTAIREVDQKHIIFIEGNWYANDFTGLTPPWDDQMVYSPHKYWSYNNPSDIDFATGLFQYDVPLYFGEGGENSNAWNRDALKLIESYGIGWAWWPVKKIESIAGLMSIKKTADYDQLLNYWKNGGNRPNNFFAQAALMELAENLKVENCFIQKDVYDAMLRQTHTDETLPFKNHKIPGKIHAADYDLGTAGIAYHDVGVATYHVSNGSFTAWNTGWAYRNDGVDIQPTNDSENQIGHSVGWIDLGEWMQYTVDVEQEGVYEVRVRTATEGFDGRYHLEIDDSAITGTRFVPHTGSFTSWRTAMVPDVVITKDDSRLKFVAEGSGFNLSTIEFVRTGDINSIATKQVSAITDNEQTVRLNLNKPLTIATGFANDFDITVNGSSVSITEGIIQSDNSRTILFTVDHIFRTAENIRISYLGNNLEAIDGSKLETFSNVDVINTIARIHAIPGRIEAEDFFFQNGVQLESTTDIGGGENIGFLDAGDFLDYRVTVGSGGQYSVAYRVASEGSDGKIQLQRIDENGATIPLHSTNFFSTGGWQTWNTSSSSLVKLPAGDHHLRLLVTGSQFNVNWFEFDFITAVEELNDNSKFSVFPNPSSGEFFIEKEDDFNIKFIEVYDISGKLILKDYNGAAVTKVDLSRFVDGPYYLKIRTEDGTDFSKRVLKN